MSSRPEIARRWLAGLRQLVAGSGGTEDLVCTYTPDVAFGGYVPGHAEQARGVAAAAAALSHVQPNGDRADWTVRRFVDEQAQLCGLVVTVDGRAAGSTLTHRRTHQIRLDDRGVHRHVVFSDRPIRTELPAGEPGPALARLYAGARERTMVAGGTSGSPMERIVTEAGQTVFAKWFVPGDGWQTRLTDDRGREGRLWSAGWLDRLPAGVGHPILAVEPYGQDLTVTITRDLTAGLLNQRLNLATMRWYLAALDSMYRMFADLIPPSGLVTLEQRWGIFWPAAVAAEHDRPDGFLKGVARGWDLLTEHVPADIRGVVRAIVANPTAITHRLHPTLLHGDAIPANAAVEGHTLVLFDWSLATAGPPEAEGAWLANFAQFYRFDIAELLPLWRAVRAGRHDEGALGLCLLGQAAGLIPALLTSVVDYPNPDHRAFSRQKLDWWIDVVRHYQHLLR